MFIENNTFLKLSQVYKYNSMNIYELEVFFQNLMLKQSFLHFHCKLISIFLIV